MSDDDDKTETKPLTMRFDVDVLERLQAIARSQDRSFTKQVNRILREWLAEYEKAKSKQGGK